MDKVPPLAWVAIGIIAVVGALVNIWMVALLRDKNLRKMSAIRRRPARGMSIENMEKFVQVLRNPFGDEQKSLDQLSRAVEKLKQQEEEDRSNPDH